MTILHREVVPRHCDGASEYRVRGATRSHCTNARRCGSTKETPKKCNRHEERLRRGAAPRAGDVVVQRAPDSVTPVSHGSQRDRRVTRVPTKNTARRTVRRG